MRKQIKRAISIMLVVMILFSVFIFSSITAAAAGQTSITLKQGAELRYASSWGWTAVKMTANGKMAYCVQPDLAAPPNGEYRTDNGKLSEIKSSDSKFNMYQKALYYCFGGDGFTTSNTAFKTNTNKHQAVSSGSTPSSFMNNLKYSQYGYEMLEPTGDNVDYLLTHLVVSYIYYGDSTYRSKIDGVKVPHDGWYDAVVDLYNALKAAPKSPVTSQLYMLNIGSSYQKVIVLRDSIKLQLTKTSSNTAITNNNSCYSLEGAKYDVFLDKSCKDKFGTITTNANGIAEYSGNVPLQTYYAKETAAPKGYKKDTSVYQFKDSGKKTSEGVPIYSISCKDTPLSDPISVIVEKQNAKTKKPLKNAEFTIKYYAGFYTADEIKDVKPTRSWVVKTGENGTARLHNDYKVSGDEFYDTGSGNPCLPLGTVTVQETKAPAGYKINSELYIQQITDELSTSGDLIHRFNPPTITDEETEGYAAVYKSDENGIAVSGATYGLYSSDAKDKNGNLLESNRIDTAITGKNGIGTFTKSFTPKTYYVQEIKAPAGYVIDKTVYSATITSANATVETAIRVNSVDKHTVTELSKTDITGTKELPGSELKLEDSKNTIVEEWFSTDKPHIIKGLLIGETYTLTETKPTDGYTFAESIKFTVNQNGVTKVVMKNDTTKYAFTKLDEDGNMLSDATLQIIDFDNNVVDEWVTDGENVHNIYGKLIVGEKYILHEEKAPKGYLLADDIEFVVVDTTDVQIIVMSNFMTVTEVTKTDITGEFEIPGAKMRVEDSDKNVVDTWISTLEPHTIKGLAIGETYTLVEEIAPAGFVTANAIEFTVNSDGSITKVIMKDDVTKILVNKVDEKKEYIKNALMQIIDKNGTVIVEWTTDGKPYEVNGILIAGETYTLHEKTAPEGYELAEDIKFTVRDTAEVQEITMIDKFDGKVTVSTPDQPIVTDKDSNGGFVQTGQSFSMFIAMFAVMISAALFMFIARKRKTL